MSVSAPISNATLCSLTSRNRLIASKAQTGRKIKDLIDRAAPTKLTDPKLKTALAAAPTTQKANPTLRNAHSNRPKSPRAIGRGMKRRIANATSFEKYGTYFKKPSSSRRSHFRIAPSRTQSAMLERIINSAPIRGTRLGKVEASNRGSAFRDATGE